MTSVGLLLRLRKRRSEPSSWPESRISRMGSPLVRSYTQIES
nr:MAG TPA: hypothetical protein [Caudoviricetes sp.]